MRHKLMILSVTLSYSLSDPKLRVVTTSRPPLGPTQWISEALFPVVKRPGREADHSPPSSAEVENVFRDILIHGVVLR